MSSFYNQHPRSVHFYITHNFLSWAIATTLAASALTSFAQAPKVFRTFAGVPFETMNAQSGRVDSLFVESYQKFSGDSAIFNSSSVTIDAVGDVQIETENNVKIEAQDQLRLQVLNDANHRIGIYTNIDDLENDISRTSTRFATGSDDGIFFRKHPFGSIFPAFLPRLSTVSLQIVQPLNLSTWTMTGSTLHFSLPL